MKPCTRLFVLGILLPCLGLADDYSVVGQTYYKDVNLQNIGDHEFGFSVSATPVEKELEFKILVSPKTTPLPTNMVVGITVRREEREILSFSVSPDKVENKQLFRFTLRSDYAAEAIARLVYTKTEPDKKRSFGVVYTFILNDYIPVAPPEAPAKPAEAPAAKS